MRPQDSLYETLAAMRGNCTVVTIVYGDIEAHNRTTDLLADVLPELNTTRTEEWANDKALVDFANAKSTNAFWGLGRATPVIAKQWVTLGGCILPEGLATNPDAISALTIDELWNLWRKKDGGWGSPEPAIDKHSEFFGAQLGSFIKTCGWETMLTPDTPIN